MSAAEGGGGGGARGGGLRGNPFFVLELPVTAGPREVEREAARLLGMLELGLAAAATYQTPLGPMPRRAEDVRTAAAALREPKRRLVAELWASGGVAAAAAPTTAAEGAQTGAATGAGAAAGGGDVRWPGALKATGWGPR
ncbi:MAG TPA: hypothetical protein VHE35_06265 [Kofleriaceae bacterium]|nr:hypothetical protein [Kofleriaceae bacterium]